MELAAAERELRTAAAAWVRTDGLGLPPEDTAGQLLTRWPALTDEAIADRIEYGDDLASDLLGENA